MASSTINWVPAGGSNSLSQTVQYKRTIDSVWIDFSSLAAGIATVSITGLSNNTIYDFRIVDNCAVGGAVPSAVIRGIKFTCPTVTISPTYNAVTISFTGVGGDVSKYVVQLLSSDLTSVLGTFPVTDLTPGTFTNTFTGLAASTSYNIRVTEYAGTAFDYSNICAATLFTTAIAPVCGVPGSVVATMS